MFGQSSTNQAVAGSPTVQNPSMLDNVTPQDFQQQTPAPQQPDPTQQQAQTYQPSPVMPSYQPPQSPHVDMSQPMVGYQEPEAQTTVPSADPMITTTDTNDQPFFGASPSGPVNPPALFSSTKADDQANDDFVENASSTAQPVDQQKLADMKQDALSHLEPLADHLGGTPEETFKTTMMMIQANDNHTLIEKALTAAKQIEDDKTRAQAMLDIINEINYFSQTN